MARQTDEQWINSLDPYNISDEDMKKCDDKVSRIYSGNRELYDRASETLARLRVGGLWRGHSACMLIVMHGMGEYKYGSDK